MNPIQQLDRILRGEATDLEALRTEQLRFSVPGMALVLNALGLIYGACMGVFAVTGSGSGAGMQVVALASVAPLLLFYYASFQLSEKNYDHTRFAIAFFFGPTAGRADEWAETPRRKRQERRPNGLRRSSTAVSGRLPKRRITDKTIPA